MTTQAEGRSDVAHKPRNVWSHQKLEEAKDSLSSHLWRELGPDDALACSLRNCEKISFCCCKLLTFVVICYSSHRKLTHITPDPSSNAGKKEPCGYAGGEPYRSQG